VRRGFLESDYSFEPDEPRTHWPMTASKRGDAIERVFREEGAAIWRALVGATGDMDVASEARAEAFAQALARGDAITNPAAWIWTASFRIAKGMLRDRILGPPLGPPDPTHLPEPVRDLVDALASLPPKQRFAIVMHDYADRTTDEIAQALGCSRATVHVHLSAGRRRLRPLLQGDLHA
jgi:RNA polymerase sigma-70 factor (ECF subfamily)